MDRQYILDDIGPVLQKMLRPTVTAWERFEGRPRTVAFDRALRAEVRDARWMLAKQWQMAEFRADDAGSPVFAKVQLSSSRLTKYKAGVAAAEPFDDSAPLEARVERRPIAMKLNDHRVSLDIRLLMGRQWLKLVADVGDYRAAFLQHYGFAVPDPTAAADADLCAHVEVWQTCTAIAGRCMDGARLYEHLVNPANHSYDPIPGVPDVHKVELARREIEFVAWFKALIHQPLDSAADAWLPDRLEYEFSCSAPGLDGEEVFEADEYHHGRLDWYNLDMEKGRPTLGDLRRQPPNPSRDTVRTMMPVQVAYQGMPNTRWWAFEDGRVNFGDVKPNTTDIGKLLFLEFGLVYGNDWLLIPYTLPTGSIARVRGLVVANVFGERFWIEPAGSGSQEGWQSWSMFTLSADASPNGAKESRLLMLPTAQHVQEGDPLEEVMFVRDEMANMVWGIERVVPLASGDSKPGAEAAAETTAYFQRLAAQAVAPPDHKAKVRYRLMSSVPENWIPFVPVHVPGDNREIQLQRAAMPRLLEGGSTPPLKIRPRTVLLREGRDGPEVLPYFIHEEEVPRAGAIVRRSFQRVRWHDGRAIVWLGMRKQAGRGGGSSGLAFDQLLSTQASAAASSGT